MFPAASGHATARAARRRGAFHGAILSTTPYGVGTAFAVIPGVAEGGNVVVGGAVSRSVARWRRRVCAVEMLKEIQGSVAPISARMALVRMGVRDFRAAAERRRRVARVAGGGSCGRALAAAVQARAAWVGSAVDTL